VIFAVALGYRLQPAQADELPAGAEKGIRVVSYNIKRGLGNDGATDLKRTAAVLRKLKPDLVALQEVDEKTQRSGKVDQAAELGKLLSMQYAFRPFMNYNGGRYGLAVLSRYPIRRASSVELPDGNEPRVALAAEIVLPGQTRFMLVNTHLDWVKDDAFRFNQAKKLKAYLNGLNIPYVLAGDFNDTPGSRTLKLLRTGMMEASKPAANRLTFSSTKPTIEIDFIFAAPASQWSLGRVEVIDEPVASDHRPVLADWLLKPAGSRD